MQTKPTRRTPESELQRILTGLHPQLHNNSNSNTVNLNSPCEACTKTLCSQCAIIAPLDVA
jgi:hypothetical protein